MSEQLARDQAAAEASEWTKNLEQASQSGRFFAAVTGFAVRGQKL
jgi:hypothetical protein